MPDDAPGRGEEDHLDRLAVLDSKAKGPGVTHEAMMRDVIREGYYDAVMESAVLMESYATSIREGAWRQERVIVEFHLKQMRGALMVAIAAFKGITE